MADLDALTVTRLSNEMKLNTYSLEDVSKVIENAMVEYLKISKNAVVAKAYADTQAKRRLKNEQEISAATTARARLERITNNNMKKDAEEKKKIQVADRYRQLIDRNKQSMSSAQLIEAYKKEIKQRYGVAKNEREAAKIKKELEAQLTTSNVEERKAIKQRIAELDEQFKDTRTKIKRLADGVDNAKNSLVEFGKKTVQMWGTWEFFKTAIKKTTEELTLANRHNFGFGDLYKNSFRLGMSIQDTVAFQKEHLQLMYAQGTSMDNFITTVNSGAEAWAAAGLEIDPQVGKKAFASLMSSVMRTGVSFSKAKDIVEGKLTKTFTMLNHSLGVTIEEYAEMNKNISEDAEHRSLMLRLSEKDRQNYHANVIEADAYLRIQKKMSKEQAQAVTDLVKKMSGETYKDRLKRSLKTQAVMGIMGVSGGADQAALIRKGGARTGDETIRMMGKMDEISRASERMKGMGPQYEMAVDTMNEKTDGMLSELQVTNSILNETLGLSTKIMGDTQKTAGSIFQTLRDWYNTSMTVKDWGITALLASAVGALFYANRLLGIIAVKSGADPGKGVLQSLKGLIMSPAMGILLAILGGLLIAYVVSKGINKLNDRYDDPARKAGIIAKINKKEEVKNKQADHDRNMLKAYAKEFVDLKSKKEQDGQSSARIKELQTLLTAATAAGQKKSIDQLRVDMTKIQQPSMPTAQLKQQAEAAKQVIKESKEEEKIPGPTIVTMKDGEKISDLTATIDQSLKELIKLQTEQNDLVASGNKDAARKTTHRGKDPIRNFQ